MDKNLVSTHKLISDYSTKARVRNIVIGWIIFIVLFGVTRVPALQHAMLEFGSSLNVSWVTSSVKFIISGFWIFIIPLAIGTFITLTKKQTFDEIRIYDSGIGFFDSKNGTECYADYSDVKLSYGAMQESFWVESKAASVKSASYGWREFSQSDVLRNNLERYAKWGI